MLVYRDLSINSRKLRWNSPISRKNLSENSYPFITYANLNFLSKILDKIHSTSKELANYCSPSIWRIILIWKKIIFSNIPDTSDDNFGIKAHGTQSFQGLPFPYKRRPLIKFEQDSCPGRCGLPLLVLWFESLSRWASDAIRKSWCAFSEVAAVAFSSNALQI